MQILQNHVAMGTSQVVFDVTGHECVGAVGVWLWLVHQEYRNDKSVATTPYSHCEWHSCNMTQ